MHYSMTTAMIMKHYLFEWILSAYSLRVVLSARKNWGEAPEGTGDPFTETRKMD